MAKGTWVKAVVLILVSAMIFGACSYSAVHEQIWEGLKTLVGETVSGGGDGGDDGDDGATSYYVYPSSTSFNVSQTVYVNVTGGGSVTSLYYRSPLPSDAWGDVQVQDMLWNNTGSQTDFDADYSTVPGWVYLNYIGGSISSDSVSFTITYNFTSEFMIWNLSSEECLGVEAMSAWYNSTYVTDEEWQASGVTVGINRTQAEAAIIGAFNGTETDVLTILHKAYLWVVDNINYSTTGGRLQNVSETLSFGSGDCDDMSTLLISMVRSQGVAAWLEQGIMYNNNTGEWQHHAWVQASVPLSNGSYVNITIDPANMQFAVFVPNRIIVYTDTTGNATLMQDYYNYVVRSETGSPSVSIGMVISTEYYSSTGTVQVPVSHMTW